MKPEEILQKRINQHKAQMMARFQTLQNLCGLGEEYLRDPEAGDLWQVLRRIHEEADQLGIHWTSYAEASTIRREMEREEE